MNDKSTIECCRQMLETISKSSNELVIIDLAKRGLGIISYKKEKIKPVSKDLLDAENVDMMVSEYDPDPKHNQEHALYDNVCALAKSHEFLRGKLKQIDKCVDAQADDEGLWCVRFPSSPAHQAACVERAAIRVRFSSVAQTICSSPSARDQRTSS